MKKIGFGTRLMALLLALTMLVSYVPGSVWAAEIGDTFSDVKDVGIEAGSLDTSDTISWPIKIYDYLNDGMLFEYSYAGDTSITEHGGGAYGGGQSMPMIFGDNTVGVDYTSVNGYYKWHYDSDTESYYYRQKYAFVNWGNKSGYTNSLDTSEEGATEVERTIAAAENDVDPMRLHLTYNGNVGTATKAYGWVSNFAKDDDQYYSKEDLRYLVMVYRTNETYSTKSNGKDHTMKAYWSISSSAYSYSFDISGGTKKVSAEVFVAPSTEWTFVILDMKSNKIAEYWDSIGEDRIAGVGVGLPLCGDGEEMDISHIAYFSSKDLATYFGERCVMFDNDPGEYVGSTIKMTQTLSGGTASSSYDAPTVSKGLDLTKTTANGGSWNDTAVTRWWNDDALSVLDNKSHTNGGYYYARISNSDTDLDTAYVKYGSTYYNVADYQYVTVVYRTNVSSPKLGFWLERGSTYAGKGFNGSSYTDKRVSITQSTGDWVSVVYDLSQINSWDGDYNTYFKGKQFNSIGIMFPGFTSSSQYMDIAYVEFSSDSGTAGTFATNAKNYLNNFTVSNADSISSTLSKDDQYPDSTYSHYMWTTGSNQGFTMLYASKGGGWYDSDSVAGGTNTWTNGYYSYQIGKSYMLGTNYSTSNNDRETARDDYGYPVSDDIFLLNTYTGVVDNLLNVTFTDLDGDGYVDTGDERDSMRFKMSNLDLGYTLYNTMKGQGVMTAGLLESSQGEFVGMDGVEHTIMQYKPMTVGYIATMLQQTLVIPERDWWGYNYTFVKGTESAIYCEDVDGDGQLDEYDEDIDGDGKLDLVNEDVNGNGYLDKSEDLDKDGNLDVNEDKDGDGVLDLSEDLDGDGNFDAWEDLNYNGLIDPGEDKDGDGKLDVGEDLDYDGRLDVWEDKNYNDLMDPGEDIDGDGKLDVNEDVNGNGVLDVFNEDRDRDGVLDRTEDLDGDGHFDVWEDTNNNGKLDDGEDLDGDGKLDVDEDIDGDEHFDDVWEDKNNNGVLDDGEDIDGDGKLDRGEDLNGNGRLDSEDFNCNGRLDLGEDIDGDGRLDTQDEDVNGNGKLDLGEDIDGDGNLDVYEDKNGDGGLDVNEDLNGNGELDKLDLAQALRNQLKITFPENMHLMRGDSYGEPTKGTAGAKLGSYAETAKKIKDEDANNNGKLDEGEDLNGNGKLDNNANLLIGPYLKCKDNIETFYDAAYYLLHNLFVPGSYNEPQNDYQYLVMNSARVPNEEGTYKDAYVFDAGFTSGVENDDGVSGTVYDKDGKRIYQTTAQNKHKIYYTTEYYTTFSPFLPINDDGEGMDEEFRYNGSPYVRDDQVTSVNDRGATYAKRNYNYVMAANGEFVYHRDDDLFFDFEGDDDVYMFINGELVLDIGGAHSITKVSFDMNDYVDAATTILGNLSGYAADMSDEKLQEILTANGITESKGLTISSGTYKGTYDMAELKRLHKLNLVDGQSYSIDFYYMERHGWGANMRIATNIVMTNPQMQPGKTAYQGVDANGNLKEVPAGGLIDDSKPVDYSFSITNGLKEYQANVKDSNTKLYRLGFQDMNIGVDISADNGLQIFGKATSTTFTATEGTTLDITGLNGIIELDGERYRVTVAGNFISSDQKTTEYIEIPAREEAHSLVLYQYNSAEVFKDVEAQIKLGSGTTVRSPSASGGVYTLELEYVNKIKVKGVRVTDQSGGILDPSDLTITVDGFASQQDFEDGKPIDTITIRVSSQEELKQFLTDLQDPNGQTVEGEGVPDGKSSLYWGSGLWKNGTVTISGMWYTLTEEEQAAKIFDNTVKTTAYKSINSPDQMVNYASHHVFTPGEPMYYQWANHTVHLELDRFWDDMLEAVVDESHTLYQNSAIEALKALRSQDADGNIEGSDTTLSSVAVEIVTANGSAPEIADNYYNNGKWATFPNSTIATQAGHRKIYYKQIYNWDETYIYYWSDTDKTMTSWPGIPMSKLTSEVDGETVEVKAGDGKSIYTVEIPEDARYVIFNNGTKSTVKDQTGNIALSFIEYNAVNFNATDRTLDVHYTSPGMHMFYAKVTSTKVAGVEAMVPVTFYVTDVKDKTYVLDYGLTTEDLNSNGAMFLTDELLGAHSGTSIKFMGVTTTQPTYLDPVALDETTGKLLLDDTQVSYGNYNRVSFVSGTPTAVDSSEGSTDTSVYMQLEDGKVYMSTPLQSSGSPIYYSNGRYVLDKRMWFTPEKIMDAEYDLWMGITVHSDEAAYNTGTLHYHPLSGTNASASDTGDIDIGAEVQMFKKLTILPATVVYYEDDFLDINYTDSFVTERDDKTAGTFVKHGEGSGELTQGIDQSVPYGQDVTYQQSLNSQMSGQSMATINIGDKNDKATFSFKGTGFEIISRTNSFDSASFVVEVFEAMKDAKGNIVKKDETADIRLPVITEFTSADVVCKHDHHTPNGYCSYCRNKVSHSYSNGLCTVCNSAQPTYYLIGFINGVGQYDTTEYEFVDGKLVTTFEQDSYVMVMDSDGNQYWTNGYPGNAVTSANLFNVGVYGSQMGNSKDKLHVPGGVEVTLNLMDNGAGGLMLSYFLEPVNLGQRTLYFDTSKAGWDGIPKIYIWSESNSMMMEWPGEDMTQYKDEDGNTVENVYYYTVPSDATMVVFNENGGLQTPNETIPGDHYMYEYYAATDTEAAHGSWVRYGLTEEEEEVPTTNTVYFENTDGWQEVYASYWSEENTTKTTVEMTQLETGGTRYTCEVPVSATNIQFHRGEPDPDRTTNTVYYDNTETAWDTVWVYAWTDAVNNGTFPGVQMTQISDTIWKAEISKDLANVIFSKGQGGDGNQTKDQTVPDGDHKLFNGTEWTSDMIQTEELTIQGDDYRYQDGNWYDHNGLMVESGVILIYFKNPYATAPKAYYWISGSSEKVVSWPGVDMVQITGTDYYYVKVPNNVDSIIFNDGGSNQTDNLTIDVATPTFEDGQWTTFVPSVTDRTVYLNNETNNWTKAYVYFWSNANGAMTEWRGMEMDVNEVVTLEDEDGNETQKILSFVANIPADAEYVKFVNDTMTKEEAGVPMGGGAFGTSDYFTGDKWASYHDDGYKIYYRNTMAWSEVYAYYWSDESKTMVEWTDVKMTLVDGEEDLYYAVLPLDAQYVIFNNGSKGTGNQTSDLEIPGNDYVYSATMWYTLDAEPEIVYYLRGDMNGWDTSTSMTKQADGTFAVTLALEPGTYEYKAGFANWSWSAPAEANASVTVETACDVTFALDVAARSVTATGDGLAVVDETSYYLRGSMNDWAATDANKMIKQADGTYAITIALAAGTYEYKGALADWSWSVPAANATVTVTTACDVTFVLDVDAGTITATGDGVDVPTETVYYLRGSMNGWAATDENKMTKQADGTYAITMSLVAGTYEYKAGVSDWSWAVPSENATLTLSADSNVTFVLDVAAGTVTATAEAIAVSVVDLDDETTDATEAQKVEARELYYENIYGWAAPVVYILHADGTIEVQTMKQVLAKHYMFTVSSDATKVAFVEKEVSEAEAKALFAEGGSAVELAADLDLYGFSYVWSGYDVKETPENITVYFDNSANAWSNVYAYAWNGDGNITGWPGQQMTKVSGNIWSITVPVDMTNIIFNNGDGSQTSDLSIPGDCYQYNGSAWSQYGDSRATTTVYFDNTVKGWSEIYVHYWRTNADGSTEKNSWPGTKMTLVTGNIYKAEVPVGITNVLFTAGEDGPQTEDLTIQGSGYIYGTSLWKDLGGKVIFFANPEEWEKVTMTYGSSSTDVFIDAPGVAMDDLGNGVWSALVPDGNNIVNFYSDKYLPEYKLPAEDNYYQDGKWYAFTTGEGKEIQQVPVIRVDEKDGEKLPYGYYIVEISGMPQYKDDTDWNHILDLQEKISNGEAEQSELDDYLASVTKDTYLYIDGVRIFQPLDATNDDYSAAENGAAFKELRSLILDGQAAVATYIVNKTSIYKGNYSWTENRNGNFVGSQIKEIDDYLLIGPNNETYINSNLNDQAVIFYVKESELVGAGVDRTLQIGARALDAGLFTSGVSTGLYTSIYQGEAVILPDGSVKYGWQPVTTVVSGTEQYYEVDYKSCPAHFVDGEKIYQVALSVRQGMVSFTSVKTNGLTICGDIAEETTYYLNDGIYQTQKHNELGSGGSGSGQTLDFKSVAMQMSIEIEDPDVEQPVVPEETVTDPALSLSYPSLSFEDEIYYNVYFTAGDISDVAEMGLMILPSKLADGTIDDAIATVPGFVTNGDLYMVRSESIAAAYMGDTVYFKVYAKLTDGTYAYSSVGGYNAKAYANTVLNGDYTDAMKQLVVAMVNYGAEAQQFFGHNTDALVNSALTADQKALVSAYDETMVDAVVPADTTKTQDFVRVSSNFKSLYPSVSFDGAFSINYYCTPAVTVDSTMTLYYWDAETYASVDELTIGNATGSMEMTESNGQYWGNVSGIAAKDMDKTYYVSCVFESEGDTITTGVIAYSLGKYCEGKAATDGDTQQAFAQATAVYGYYAKQYFASIA